MMRVLCFIIMIFCGLAFAASAYVVIDNILRGGPALTTVHFIGICLMDAAFFIINFRQYKYLKGV